VKITERDSLSLSPLPNPPREGEGIYLSAPLTPVLPTGKFARKIGIVWAGSKTHKRDDERSIPLKFFEPVLSGVRADFYAPFLGEALEEIGDYPITRLDALISDFADTAALLKRMDCLVTVDTAVAHLAGALGVKTYLLISKCPDWRWGTEGEKTALYPSVTLVRQTEFGDWKGAVEKLLAMLKGVSPERRG
jgi:ADP-heptose:LPS heptosyltransferase